MSNRPDEVTGRAAAGPLARLVGWRRFILVGLLVAAGSIAAACASGTYPLDIFYEMHYAQSYGFDEPPRLSPPEGAIPITGNQPATAENPVPGQGIAEGARLFVTNCVICHGPAGKGDGPVLKTIQEKYGYKTEETGLTLSPDLSSSEPDHAQSIPDETVLGWISNGSAFVMPPFAKLLSVDERWLLVNYIKHCLGEERSDDCPPPPQ